MRLLVLLLVVALGGGGVARWVLERQGRVAEVHQFQEDFETAVKVHYLRNGEWPSAVEVWDDARLPRCGTARSWGLIVPASSATDPWGRPYLLTPSRVATYGPDGCVGGGDDHVWTLEDGACSCGFLPPDD